jgi:hypothetical protein
MAQGDFDYDLLSYDVIDHSAYAADYSPHYYGSVYADPWCYSFSCGGAYYGSPFSVAIVFGRPYRSYYYDPYFYAYNPFYNPFFYNPYYYAPAYYPRYIYPRPYYPYSYGGGYYPYGGGYYRYRSYGQPFTPYRFRGADGFTAGYRDRRYDLRRSINPAHNPRGLPVRQPAIATPARRVIDPKGAALPNGPANRRLIDEVRRVQSGPVEARRARPEDRQDRSAGEPRLIRREVEARRAGEARNAEPRGDRGRDVGPREEPRQVEHRARDSRPAPEVRSRGGDQRASPPPSSNRGGGGRSDSRGGGFRESGGERSSGDGGRRHR